MLSFIKGTVATKLESSVIIENASGLGFEVFVPAGSRLYLAESGAEVTCYTYMAVREDDISLYGFDERSGLQLFKKLITVNGVGAKAAMAILSAIPAADLKQAIVFEDVAMLTRANGIGKKTAQRIVLDLKDKMDGIGEEAVLPTGPSGVVMPGASLAGGSRAEAIEALVALGYSMAEATEAVKTVEGEDLDVEDYIKGALKAI